MKDNFSYRVRRVVQFSFYVLAASFIGMGFTSKQALFSGLALGCSLAMLSAVYTAWKIHKLGETAIRYNGQRKRVSLGTLARFAVAVLAAAVALKYPQRFDLPAVVVGLMVPPLVAFLDGFYLNRFGNDAERRG